MPVSLASPCRPAWALDAIAVGVLSACGLLFLPGAGRTPLGDPGHLLAQAAWLACAGALALRGAARPLFRLRLAALAAAGLAPFASWGVRFAGNPFLVGNGTLALLAGVWLLFELAETVVAEAERLRNPWLALEARRGIALLLYFLLIPVAAVHVSFALSLLVGRGAVLEDLRETWRLVPAALRWILVLPAIPVANVARLLWLLRSALCPPPPHKTEED